MIAIAIDGPAGAGKSSVARAAAKKLGYIYIDTGALYRAVGLYMLQKGIDVSCGADVAAATDENIQVDIAFMEDGQHVLLCGNDVSGKIRTEEVSMAASLVSAVPRVREFLFSLQRELAAKHNVIMDGRDIGTVVLPQAQVKIFLTASAEVRAGRRQKELAEKGQDAPYEKILSDIRKRDEQDMNRPIAPLKAAEDAVTIDTSTLSFEEVVEMLLDTIQGRLKP